MKRFIAFPLLAALATVAGAAVLAAVAGATALAGVAGASQSGAKAAPPASSAAPQARPGEADFIKAAGEVLHQMSQLLSLPIKEPLKKSLRSKDEIRKYLIEEDKEDRTDAQRYADDKSLEAFGLIPKGFPLDQFMLNVLTDQVAGLYDPKAKEFYIADWTAPGEQREVMAHELTHALEDQSFHIDPWIKAARPNDDAELARDAVSEGSALAAMVDYSLQGETVSVRDLPDVSALIRAGAVEDMDNDPKLSKAPPYIRDALLFPYIAGATFMQQFLKAHSGWADLHLVFENPPASTQQILHPALYLAGRKPANVSLPDWKGLVPADWKLLEENVMGEFGLSEVLKQLENQESADAMAPAWAGDRYAVFEDSKSKSTPLVLRLALDNTDDAARFFGHYSEALELKHKTRTALFRRPNFFQFQTDTGGVFLRCLATTCLAVEGASRDTFDKIDRAIGWPPAPTPSPSAAPKSPTNLSATP
ncbi:MAG TPA: hypothetical protein VN661_02275 [Candidatus Acidoferrales bacterium]|nr:hypothetical protein [Candidatus Acidoferrales bacterium]